MLLTRKFPEIRDPIIMSYPVISAVRLRWGNSAGCELIGDRLGRGFLPLWGVVNNTGIYFIIIGGWVFGWRETGFLRRYLIGGEDIGNNPVSEMVRGDEKPGFCEDI
ncbi:hypothetical protein QUA43_01825 [Microcoleus sp. N9_B4]|uniref:hypothetical protein n=1 Tax=Microcoleus sp. N9_B4 TaxID=3055386 RepID=UPI002FCF8D25